MVAGVCNLALFHPSPPDFHPLHTPCNPFDPFPLSRSNAVAVLFFLPSHPLSGSFALIHRSPRPSPLTPQSSTFPGLLSSLVDEERERGNATGSKRGDFPLPPPTSVGVSMSRCVGHCEGTTAPGILPFIRFV